jgi:hypothetical protein
MSCARVNAMRVHEHVHELVPVGVNVSYRRIGE